MMEESYVSKTEDQESSPESADISARQDDNVAPIVVSGPEQFHADVSEVEVSMEVSESIACVESTTAKSEQEPVIVPCDRSKLEERFPPSTIPGTSTEHLESTVVNVTESMANIEVGPEESATVTLEAAANNIFDSELQAKTNEETISSTQTMAPVKTSSRATQPSLESSVFKVKSIKWYDPYGQTRESPIVLQNKNGPCPLLALVNTLILSTPPGQDSPLSRISTTRTEINALYLLELLGDLLLSSNVAEITDVNNVLSLLPSLHTGLNINPRFDGTFEESEELALFRAFEVDLVHGWVSNPDDSYVHNALMKAASYEGAQSILVAMSELSTKLDKGEPLTANELLTMEYGRIIEHFLHQTATQLTTFGLSFLSELLLPGSLAVFFRNDHFSTVYRHPDSKQIFMLVTDAGFSSHKNIVWESLNDLTGSSSLFFNGMFVPSEFGDSEPDKKDQVPQVHVDSHDDRRTTIPLANHDGDYALAIELQMKEDRELALQEARREEEDARRSARRADRRTNPSYPQRTAQFAPTQPSQHGSSSRGSAAGSTSERRSSKPLMVHAAYGQEARDLLNEFQPGTSNASSSGNVSRHSSSRPVATSSSSKKNSSDKDKCIVM
ncbi:uncharacterized protein V1513DRAFT_451325 [Lipomyces chichibuensis]|uniref:uncharacterized protein n=1 Tax=Lipomyces chichibuensis TaxID=1546026 RepID=UPI0033438B77